MRGAHGLLGLIQVCSRVYWVWSKCDRVQNLALDANWYASGDWPKIVFGLISSSANEINQGERWHNRTWIGFKNLDSIIIIIIINLWKSKNEREEFSYVPIVRGMSLTSILCMWDSHGIHMLMRGMFLKIQHKNSVGFDNLKKNIWKSKNMRERERGNYLMRQLYRVRLSQACDLMHVGFTCLWETHFIKQAYEILSYQKGMMLNKKIRENEEYM